MPAKTTTSPPPLFKPRDLVETPGSERLAKVLEILPAGYRRVQFLDGGAPPVTFHKSELKLVQEGRPRPWKEHSLG